ncbi:MAG TPA: putative capsular polysaccharide synthesis family protein [Bacteroidia bacterium]|jgi:hypothetical protein|nr:putative capsular polysaccharide synthesis family protein [Bacteroidia bacterium]
MRSIGAIVYQFRSKLRVSVIKSNFKKNIGIYPPVIVYQMGKVASMSIYTSLKEQYKGITLHRHILDDKEDWQAQFLIEHANEQQKPLRLISMMREPIGRNVSAFFQNFEYITGIKPEDSKFSIDELIAIFFANPKMYHDVPLTWFDNNIKKHFGIDIYAKPFPKEQGWAILKKGNIELLLMKSEISDEKKSALVKEFMKIDGFRLSASNIAEDKEYADMYKTFKQRFQPPKEYLDMFYTSSKIEYFYTGEELATARKKWGSK